MESVWTATHTLPPGWWTLEPGASFDTVIAGAGLTGLATAVLLARAGQRVAVLEARRMGAVTTGHTTGKVTLLQGTDYSAIRRHNSDAVLGAYATANKAAQEWLLGYLDQRQVDYQRRTAYTYANSIDGLGSLQAELDACRLVGLEVDWADDTELPFAVAGAIALPGQAQIHSIEVLDALATEFRELGGLLAEGVRVVDAEGDPLRVVTTAGDVGADRLVLATGIPVFDRAGYFAKLSPERSYAQTYRLPGGAALIPQGMYLSADAPDRSLRSVPLAEEELLLVGGNDHVVGREDSPAERAQELRAWTEQNFPEAELVHAWSAQDYRSIRLVPFVGPMPNGGGRVDVATGYNKWGMTNAVAAALALSGDLLGRPEPWADELYRGGAAADVLDALGINASVAYHLATDWGSVPFRPLPEEDPPEGVGYVGHAGGAAVAASTVDGVTCRVSARCTHLGGLLGWNDQERSWDCPLHGSRFGPDGSLLEGPAVKDLPRA